MEVWLEDWEAMGSTPILPLVQALFVQASLGRAGQTCIAAWGRCRPVSIRTPASLRTHFRFPATQGRRLGFVPSLPGWVRDGGAPDRGVHIAFPPGLSRAVPS